MRAPRGLLRAERPLLLVLAVLVFTASLVSALVPGLLAQRYDGAVRQVLDAAAPDTRGLTVAGGEPVAGGLHDPLSADAAITELSAAWRDRMPAVLRAVTGSEFAAASSPLLPLRPATALIATRAPGLESRIRYVQGRSPHSFPGVIEVGVPTKAAATLGLRVGGLVRLSAKAALRISGLYEPVTPGDPFWAANPDYSAAVQRPLSISDEILESRAMLDAAGYEAMYRAGTGFGYLFTFPLVASKVDSAHAGAIADAVDQYKITVGDLQLGGARFTVSTQLDQLLRGHLAQRRAAATVLNLALGGLAAAAIGVLLIGCVVLLERIGGGLSTMRARGASGRQLALLAGSTVGVYALPAALLGFVCARTLSWQGPLAVLLTMTLGPAVLAAWTHRRPLRDERRDFAARRAAPRRVVLELLVASVAVIGVVVLRRRGLEGDDPFLTMVPFLLAAAAGIVTLRLLPYPLRLSSRLVARSRSAVPFLGLLRAARQRPATALPLVTMLMAMAMAAFALTLDAGLRHAQDSAARASVGADAQVSGPTVTAAQVARLKTVPGVRSVVPARVVAGAKVTVGVTDRTVTLIGIDRGTGGALLSPALARALGSGQVSVTWPDGPPFALRQAGVIDRVPGLDAGDEFVVVPYRMTGGWATNVFVSGTMPAAALQKAAAGLDVRTVSAVHSALTRSPLVRLVHDGFGYGGLGAAGLGAMALTLALVIEAEARGRTLSYLRTLGLGRAQLRLLTMVELGPLILGTAVVGWLLGVGLPALLGSAIDLSPYTGGIAVPYRPFDPVITAVLAGGLLVVAGIALSLDAAVGARRAEMRPS